MRINVFLSSTYIDLKLERERINSVVKRLKWPHVHWMENETSQDEPIAKRSLEMIDDSQVYIGIIGSRYGSTSVDDENLLSLTEREFEHATKLKLYRMVFVSERRKEPNMKDFSLELFKKKIQQSIWPDYFKNEDDLAVKVSVALSNIWNELNGRMHVVAFKPWQSFAACVDPLIELRTCIANDCGVEPQKVWLTNFDAPIPEVTKCVALLPNFHKNIYINKGPTQWSGPVIHASNCEPDAPSSWNPELFKLVSLLHKIVEDALNEKDRYKAVEEWVQLQRRQ